MIRGCPTKTLPPPAKHLLERWQLDGRDGVVPKLQRLQLVVDDVFRHAELMMKNLGWPFQKVLDALGITDPEERTRLAGKIG